MTTPVPGSAWAHKSKPNAGPRKESSALRRSCDACQDAKIKCSQHKPTCRRCSGRQPCVYSPLRRVGRPRKKKVQLESSVVSVDNGTHQHTTEGVLSSSESASPLLPPPLPRTSSEEAAERQGSSFIAELRDGQSSLASMPDLLESSLGSLTSMSPHNCQANQEIPFLDDFMSHNSTTNMNLQVPNIFGYVKSPGQSRAVGHEVSSFGGSPKIGTGPSQPCDSSALDSRTLSIPNTAVTSPRLLDSFETLMQDGNDYTDLEIDPFPGELIGHYEGTQTLSFGSERRLTLPRTNTCVAKCYLGLLKQLLFLDECLPETAQPSIDIILQVERDLRCLQDRLLACRTCMANRSSLLMLSIVAERIVQMLESIFERKADLDARKGSGAMNSTERAKRSLIIRVGTSSNDGGCPLPLHVGGAEVDTTEKDGFMKRLLQLRLKLFTTSLRELQQALDTCSADCNHIAGNGIVLDSLERLSSLRGRIQLWN